MTLDEFTQKVEAEAKGTARDLQKYAEVLESEARRVRRIAEQLETDLDSAVISVIGEIQATANNVDVRVARLATEVKMWRALKRGGEIR